MIEAFGFILIYLGLMVLISVFKKRDAFLTSEAKRYFLQRNEIDDNWHSHGRVFTKGIALIKDKKTGKKKFIKQAELCDIGILS